MNSADPHPRIISINISPGGIPKLPVPRIKITTQGLEGDGHNHEKHYRLYQAVSLQDMSTLTALNAEGYDLKPGTTGENINLDGININALDIGTRLEFDKGVILEIAKVRKPCYVLDSISPRLKSDIEGRCGMYARVLVEGTVEVGEGLCVRPAVAG